MKRGEGVSCLSTLPEGCLTEILSRTTPRDVCRLSATSSAFNAAAQADSVWSTFLPSDLDEIVSASVNRGPLPVPFPSKRELFFHLCHFHLLLQNYLRFSLDKENGKKCYMILSTGLSNANGDTLKEWRWTALCESGATPAIKFHCGSRVGLIQGKIRTRMLSPNTTYAAYFVFTLLPDLDDYYPVSVLVNYVKEGRSENKYDTQKAYLTAETHAYVPVPDVGHFSQLRNDGRMEIKMGGFFNGEGTDDEVKMLLKSFKALFSTLYVHGIELRPIEG